MVLGEESYDSLYSNEERNEFLFRIFSHVVLGGPVNQVSRTHIHIHTHMKWLQYRYMKKYAKS